MILVDTSIKQLIAKGLITNFTANIDLVNPASLDVTLDPKLLVYNGNKEILRSWVDSNETHFRSQGCDSNLGYVLQPGEFVLASTREEFDLPSYLGAEFCLKSRLGRIGLEHQLAGWIDPGFKGKITLELVNNAPYPIAIKAGQRIGQLKFHLLNGAPDKAYAGHYQGQTEVMSAVVAKDSTI